MTSNPDDMDTEADAIMRVLEVAKGNRAFGNAIDPRPAAEFIRAYLDCRP